MLWRRILLGGLKTGLAAFATTTAAIMLFGERERRAPWSAVNAVSHLVLPGRRVLRGFSPLESAVGLACNGAAMLLWGVAYEGALALSRTEGNVATAGLATAAIYAIDYHLLPPRWWPGFERVLSTSGVAGTYVALGATLAASRAWRGDARPLLPSPNEGERVEGWFV